MFCEVARKRNVTVEGSAKVLLIDGNARELFTRFHVAERGVRELFVCGGATQDHVEESFKEMVRTRFWANILSG
jgi:hypothetical protein